MSPATPNPPSARTELLPYVGPMTIFALFLFVPSLMHYLAGGSSDAETDAAARSLWLRTPEYWVYPLQALVCGAALLAWRRHYQFGLSPRALTLGTVAGVLALVLWIAPQTLLGATPRTGAGFDPTPLVSAPALYALVLAGRFLRLVVAVPFVEEIFWRGFLLRYLTPAGERDGFTRAPYTFTPASFGIVAVCFMLEHSPPDWPAALLVGALYNFLAIRTGSLGACVLAHAVTNAGLGVYVLLTRQWGFW
ncbi:MAG: CAAX prenyl protease-related protein [Verrucomicrobia bacterium]|nr:CAAX prenyl protease-related protein [Verrucomicrobiota bacterium]